MKNSTGILLMVLIHTDFDILVAESNKEKRENITRFGTISLAMHPPWEQGHHDMVLF